jgi:hypothetical protein
MEFEIIKRGVILKINFDFDFASVFYRDGEFTVYCMAIDWEEPFDAYGLEEEIVVSESVTLDSESGCFFAYTENPKDVVEILKEMKRIVGLNYTDKQMKKFIEHPNIRLKYVI